MWRQQEHDLMNAVGAAGVGVYAVMEIHRTHCFGRKPDSYSYVETSECVDGSN